MNLIVTGAIVLCMKINQNDCTTFYKRFESVVACDLGAKDFTLKLPPTVVYKSHTCKIDETDV
jgi:hypothetical protein